MIKYFFDPINSFQLSIVLILCKIYTGTDNFDEMVFALTECLINAHQILAQRGQRGQHNEKCFCHFSLKKKTCISVAAMQVLGFRNKNVRIQIS